MEALAAMREHTHCQHTSLDNMILAGWETLAESALEALDAQASEIYRKEHCGA